MPPAGGAHRPKKDHAHAFGLKRPRRQPAIAPRLEIIPVQSYNTPLAVRHRPARNARAAASSFSVELDSDPISSARFSTPRPFNGKQRKSTAFNMASAKKRKVVRVKAPPPRFSMSESPVKHASGERDVLAAHPTLLVPTCESDEGRESCSNRQTNSDNDGEELNGPDEPENCVERRGGLCHLSGTTEAQEPSAVQLSAKIAATVTESRAVCAGAPSNSSFCESPAMRSPSDTSKELSSPGNDSCAGAQRLLSPHNSFMKSIAINSPREQHSQTTHRTLKPQACNSGSSKVPVRTRSGNESAPAESPAVLPPKYSLSVSPSPLSQREVGVLALHPTLEVPTLESEEFEEQSKDENNNLVCARAAINVEVLSQPEPDDRSVASYPRCDREKVVPRTLAIAAATPPSSIEKTPTPVLVAPMKPVRNNKNVLILYSDSQPQPNAPVSYSDEGHLAAMGSYQEGPITKLATVEENRPESEAEPEALSGASNGPCNDGVCSPGAIQSSFNLIEFKKSSIRRPRSDVLVPETPSDERHSPALVEETPPSDHAPRLNCASDSFVTPGPINIDSAAERQNRHTPLHFTGFTPGSNQGSAIVDKCRVRLRRVSWSDRRDSFPRCAQTPPDFNCTPAPPPASSPVVVLGTVLKRAPSPRVVTMPSACDILSGVDSTSHIVVETPVGEAHVSPPARNPRITCTDAMGKTDDVRWSQVDIVPETCLPATQTPDPVCQRALEFVNARVLRINGGEIEEGSDSSTEPPVSEDIAEGLRFCLALDEGEGEQGPQPAGYRELVPSGALAISSSELDEDDT